MGENMQPLKLRLIMGGGIVSILGAALTLLRGYAPWYLGLLVVGIVALILGLLWPKPKPKAADSPLNEGE